MKKLFFSFLLLCNLFYYKISFGEEYSEVVKNAKKVFYVDMKKFLNWSYDDKYEKIGWIGLGADTDLEDIPKGKVEFYGVPFYIYSPDEVKEKTIISVGYSSHVPFLNLPMKVGPIPVKKKANALFFLHSSGWVNVGEGEVVGIYRIIYKDGKEEEFKIRRGYEIEDWWWISKETQFINGKVAWTKVLSHPQREVGTCMTMWKNPNPKKEIKEIIIEGNDKAQLFLFAITGIQ